jgi:VanZ family protein
MRQDLDGSQPDQAVWPGILTMHSDPAFWPCGRRNRGANLPVLISLLAVAGVILLSLVPSAVISGLRTPLPAAFEHALAYAALGAMLALSLRLRKVSAGLLVIIALTLLAAMLETMQLFVPGRSFWLSDIMGSTAGACLGVVTGMMANRLMDAASARRNAALLRKRAEVHSR